MQTKASTRNAYLIPYVLWMVLFVVAPVLLVIYYSFFDVEGNFTFGNYATVLHTGVLADDAQFVLVCISDYGVLTADRVSNGVYADPDEA